MEQIFSQLTRDNLLNLCVYFISIDSQNKLKALEYLENTGITIENLVVEKLNDLK